MIEFGKLGGIECRLLLYKLNVGWTGPRTKNTIKISMGGAMGVALILK
jgi:hypothetical protein